MLDFTSTFTKQFVKVTFAMETLLYGTSFPRHWKFVLVHKEGNNTASRNSSHQKRIVRDSVA